MSTVPKFRIDANVYSRLMNSASDGPELSVDINICRNNAKDVRQLTEYAHAHRIATDYHINETPMLEQDDHFKHLSDNRRTYIQQTGAAPMN